jgi:hypothetical protein
MASCSSSAWHDRVDPWPSSSKDGIEQGRPGRATNRGVAKAGFILGIIGLILSVLGAILAVVIIANAPKSIESLCALPLQASGSNGTLERAAPSPVRTSLADLHRLEHQPTNMSGANFSGTSWSAARSPQ